MWNLQQKLPLYKLLLIFHVVLLPQVMIITPVIIILLLNLIPVILPIIINTEILLYLKVWVNIFHQPFHILHYIISPQHNKYITFSNIPPHSKTVSPFIVNNSHFPLLWRSYIISYTSLPTSYFSHRHDSEEALTYLFFPY